MIYQENIHSLSMYDPPASAASSRQSKHFVTSCVPSGKHSLGRLKNGRRRTSTENDPKLQK